MRRAFVIGSNGPAKLDPLRYASKDAKDFADCLSGHRCGFEVVTPREGADVFEVRRELYTAVESCIEEDIFICYFSGHGLLDQGRLVLLWDQTERDRLLTTALPVLEITQALNSCRARNKLLILDCCHAGAVTHMLGMKDAGGVPVEELQIAPDNCLILMASGRLEKAREVETLQGSFLTTNICTALTDGFHEVDENKDNKISLLELVQWLGARAKQHNSQYPDMHVPYPYLFGKQKGDFFLTLDAPRWIPYELPWVDGSTMVVLPVNLIPHFPLKERRIALCMAKYPVTNAQFRKFVESTDLIEGSHEPVAEPIGQHLSTLKKRWEGPFYPWREDKFRDPDKPVVCVSYRDAEKYCLWVNRSLGNLSHSSDFFISGRCLFPPNYTFLPTGGLWNFAAFGTERFLSDPASWLAQSSLVHHKASSPAPIDTTGARTNSRGISDMIGNVWEWCSEPLRFSGTVFLGVRAAADLAGGGFLDDLSEFRQPILTASMLEEGEDTRHSDLGFRIAGTVKINDLPSNVQYQLSLIEPRQIETLLRHNIFS